MIDKGSTLGGEEEDDDIENGDNVSGGNTKASRMVLSQADREEWAAIYIQTAFRGFLVSLNTIIAFYSAQLLLLSSSWHRFVSFLERLESHACNGRGLIF